MTQGARKEKAEGATIDYQAIIKSATFQELLHKKKSFILPMSIFFFLFYFALPLMTSYTKVLNTPAIGSISWAWIFAFAQFVMTWTLCMIYTKKAKQFDTLVDEIKETHNGGMR